MSRATVSTPRSKKGTPRKSIARAGRTFRATVNYLDSLTNYERVLGAAYNKRNFSLARMNRILKVLDNPHKAVKTAHIAGTKGKGSTATMLAEMIRSSGAKVGLYTSPHILDIRERIRIDGEKISESQFVRVIAAVESAAKKAKIADPTYFEMLTAAAFLYFAQEEVAIAVIETGLGGRLDSTNVVTPEVVGITSISMDHMAQLGHDLGLIAAEKAAVMKKGVVAISAPQPEKVRNVLMKAAMEIGATLHFANENVDFSYRFEFSRAAGRHARICVTTPRSRFEHLQVPLFGEHQATNCCLALNMLDVLKSRGFAVDDQHAIQGLSRVELLGRMQLISEEPRILVDGAHNAASIDALMRAIGQHIPYDSMIVIFACQKDKDIPGMIRRLQVGADKMIFTYTGSPRTADAEELAAQYMEVSGKMAQVARTLDDAMQIAQSAITREDLICITGSFYLVAEAMRKYAGKNTAPAAV